MDGQRRVGTRRRITGAIAAISLAFLIVAADAGAYIYWASVNVSRTIGRANLDGTGIDQTFVDDTHVPDQRPCGVAVDSGHIYWGNHSRFDPGFLVDSTIGRANLDGTGTNQSFITGANGPCGVAVAGGFIYWANWGVSTPGTTIGRANLDGTGANNDFITGANRPCGVAVDGTHVYWANIGANSIGRANLDGTGADQNFITGANAPCGVAVNAGSIYWANSGWGFNYPTGTTIGRANIDGTGVNQSFITGAVGPSGVALDGEHLYWTNTGAPPSTVGRANLDGTGVQQRFIPASANPNGVAVDSGAPSNIFKLAKTVLDTKLGTAVLKVKVPGPGELELRGKGVKPVAEPVKKTGVEELTVRAKGKAKRLLRENGEAKVTAKVRFDPDGSAPTTQKTRITLKRG